MTGLVNGAKMSQKKVPKYVAKELKKLYHISCFMKAERLGGIRFD